MVTSGLELALRARGIEMVRCAVGVNKSWKNADARPFAWRRQSRPSSSDYLFTGDGLCTALNVLRTVALTGRPLADLAGDLTTYPQVLLNVRVREKADLTAIPEIAVAIDRIEARLAGHGRLLVRYSGTEPLLRVMLEGRDEREIRQWAEEIVAIVAKQLG